MRVLFWKFHCPSFICFCKSSHLSLSNSCSLELEDSSQQVSSTVSSLPNSVVELPGNDQIEDDKERAVVVKTESDHGVDVVRIEKSDGLDDVVGELCDDDVKFEDEKERVQGEVHDDAPLRSSLKKPSGSRSNAANKGKVQWMDFLGKELAEIREFEPRTSLFKGHHSRYGGKRTRLSCFKPL